MRPITRLLDTTTTSLGPNRIEAIAGTSGKARDGHVVDMRGVDTTAFMRAGTILWGHDPMAPVGTPVSCYVDGAGNLRLVVDFAPAGTSETADEIRRLVKAGVVRNMSIGFEPLEMKPLDPRLPRGGQRITRAELLEVSFVSVPADPGAIVTARAGRAGKALSGANATALRQAHQLADQCRATLAGVLGGAGVGLEPDADDFERRQRHLAALTLARTPNPDLDRRMRQLAVLELRGRMIEEQAAAILRVERRRVRANPDRDLRMRQLALLQLRAT